MGKGWQAIATSFARILFLSTNLQEQTWTVKKQSYLQADLLALFRIFRLSLSKDDQKRNFGY